MYSCSIFSSVFVHFVRLLKHAKKGLDSRVKLVGIVDLSTCSTGSSHLFVRILQMSRQGHLLKSELFVCLSQMAARSRIYPLPWLSQGT